MSTNEVTEEKHVHVVKPQQQNFDIGPICDAGQACPIRKQVIIVLFSNKKKTNEETKHASEVNHPVKRILKLAWRDEQQSD